MPEYTSIRVKKKTWEELHDIAYELWKRKIIKRPSIQLAIEAMIPVTKVWLNQAKVKVYDKALTKEEIEKEYKRMEGENNGRKVNSSVNSSC